MTPAQALAGREQLRWERIAIGIRCAYNPGQPAVIRQYLTLGGRLARSGLVPERRVMQRMLQLLLQAAHDDALPWLWRSACIEHTTLPLAQLSSLLAAQDPVAVEALHAFVQVARDRLGQVPPAGPLGPVAFGGSSGVEQAN